MTYEERNRARSQGLAVKDERKGVWEFLLDPARDTLAYRRKRGIVQPLRCLIVSNDAQSPSFRVAICKVKANLHTWRQ